MTVLTHDKHDADTKLAYRDLVDDVLWERLIGRIVEENEGIERPFAERIMNEALGFLKLCAAEPDGFWRPSETVDIGWHTFVGYTVEYAAFCQRIAGTFIHHEPTDVPGADYSKLSKFEDTAAAMRRYGPVDDMLWVKGAHCGGFAS